LVHHAGVPVAEGVESGPFDAELCRSLQRVQPHKLPSSWSQAFAPNGLPSRSESSRVLPRAFDSRYAPIESRRQLPSSSLLPFALTSKGLPSTLARTSKGAWVNRPNPA
jgi:hypothetical protein